MARGFIRNMLVLLGLCFLVGCSGTPTWNPQRTEQLRKNPEPAEVRDTLQLFQERDPSLAAFFKEAEAYAVFPTVVKIGAGLGGSYGDGYVYSKGRLIGLATIGSGSLGPQLGAQKYRELIFFRDAGTINQFKKGDFELSGQVSAIATDRGAGAKAAYNEGLAIFVMPYAGLMFEASVAGQKFTFEPFPPEKK